MNQNNNQRWNKMYGEIHKMIPEEIIEKKNNFPENDNTKIKQYSFSLIKRIMQKIEVKIKEFNMQFSDFGVILNDIGERCLFYFAIFTIWRILCFGQYQSTESNIKELKDQMEEQYTKVKADIQQNKKEQSKIRGQTQAQDIINLSYQRKLQEQSFEIMKNLDKEILERGDKNITDDQIMEYIRNQSTYIEKYVKDKISNIKTEISTKLTDQLKKDMKSHLQKVSANTKNLHDFVFDSLKAQDYFKQLNNRDEAPELIQNSFQVVFKDKLKRTYSNQQRMIRGVHSKLKIFMSLIILYVWAIQKSDAEIQILLDFVSAFEKTQGWNFKFRHFTD